MRPAEKEALLRSLGAAESELSAAEREALDRDGYFVLRDLLTPEHIARILGAIERLIAQARLDPTWHAGGTLHLLDLVNEPAFDPVWMAPRLLSAIAHVIGYDMRIDAVAYRAPKPGYGAQTLHADYVPGHAGEYQVATAIVALVDFTNDNGATRLIPGSHVKPKLDLPSDAQAPDRDQLTVTCPAGSAVVFNGHIRHSGMRNTSAHIRHALQLTFSRRGATITGTARIENATLERLGDAAFLFL